MEIIKIKKYSQLLGKKPYIYWLLFVFILAAGSWIYVHKSLAAYSSAPLPIGDAREYHDMAGLFYEGRPPMNPWLCRWPGWPLIISTIWMVTGETAAVQYLISAIAMVAAVMLASLLAWKRGGPILGLSSLALLLFLPASMSNTQGLSDPLFALLLLLLLLIGYRLPEKPLLYALPAAFIVCFFIITRETGRHLALFLLILFSFYYFRNRLFSLKLVIALLICVCTGIVTLLIYYNYRARYNLIPMDLRYGITAFYFEFLQHHEAFYDDNRIYALMSFFDWLKLHPRSNWLKIFFTGFWNLQKVFDSILFTGAFLLVTIGLIRAAFDKWLLEILLCVFLTGLSIPYFIFGNETRFLIYSCLIGLPAAMAGFSLVASSLFPKSQLNFRKNIAVIIPPAFCILALLSAHYITAPPDIITYKSSRYPDQSDSVRNIKDLLASGKLEEAQDSIKSGLSKNPELAFYHFCRGFILYLQNNEKEAFAELDSSISLNPYQTAPYLMAFHFMWREGRREQALLYLERSMEYRPENPFIRKILKTIDQGIGRPDKKELFDKKGPFEYYVQNPILNKLIFKNCEWWLNLLYKFAPLNDKIKASSAEKIK